MGRRAVEIEVIFLYVLAVIALAVGQAEQPLLEDRVLAVPQGERKAQPLLVVAETGEAILAPVIGARPCLIVGEVVPGVAVLAVVLADRAPLTFTEIWPPLPPTLRCFGQTQFLCGPGKFAIMILRHLPLLYEFGRVLESYWRSFLVTTADATDAAPLLCHSRASQSRATYVLHRPGSHLRGNDVMIGQRRRSPPAPAAASAAFR